MSSGVSDQMKVPGSTGKNLERNIPWSQQVDEASYENLASPANDDNNSAANNSSMQFQYPPFNAKESSNNPWNNYNKSRKPSNNYDTGKKFGKPDYYNNAKRDDYHQQNAWGRRNNADNSTGYNRVAQTNRYDDAYAPGKLDNKSSANMAIEQKKFSATPAAAAPKKTTWASILSQPVKPTSRTTLTTSSHKKKGPGMPPPPMVPGKHNLDVNTWDLPNNNPPPVPSPPPPLDLSQIDSNADPILGPGSSMFRHDLAGRPDKNIKAAGSIDFVKDENKSNYNNSNYGRVRSSPNGHSRKNWAPPPQLGQPQVQSGRNITGPVGPGASGNAPPMGPPVGGRRIISDGGPVVAGNAPMAGNAPGAAFRYRKNEQRQFGPPGPRSDADNAAFNYRDENNPRNNEQNTQEEEPTSESVLEELHTKNNYNPAKLDLEKARLARFFVIKSYSEDDIHRSIKYEIWCSTDHGNKRLDEAFNERQSKGGHILLFFSVNGSGHFCGMAEMITAVDYNSNSNVWSQDKWKGKFKVKWIYVKDVPNIHLRHIRLENNSNKSVTNSRDVQEVPNARGIEVLQILHSFKHSTSIFDDFYHYEKKQEEEVSYKKPSMHYDNINHAAQSPINRHYGRQPEDRRGDMGQKYFGNVGNAGGPPGGGGREGGGGFRNIMQRGNGGGYYSEHRRFDNNRSNMDRDIGDGDKERDCGNNGADYGNNRYAQKYDNNRRLDERPIQLKHNNREKERDFNEDKQQQQQQQPPHQQPQQQQPQQQQQQQQQQPQNTENTRFRTAAP